MEMLSATTTYDLLIQTPHSPVITLAGAHQAEATTTIHEVIRASGSELNLEQYGIYFDDLTRIDGEWKFTHRLFVPFYVSSGGVTGDVPTPRSALLQPGRT